MAGVARSALGWLWWRARFPRARVDAGSGSALGSHVPGWTPPLFAWQAWHLETFIFVSRGRRGTWRHPPSFHVAGVALGDMDRHFAWQAWHVWHWAGSGGALGSHVPGWTPRLFAWQAWHLETLITSQAWYLVTSTFVSRGRRGTWRHGSSVCVAGVARMALGWLWWRAWFPRARVDAAAFCVAGVALGDIHLRFTWQAWYMVTPTFVSRGRRGTWRHGSSVCVAGVARMALGWLWWRARFPRARVAAAAVCVAGVALGDIHLRFTWQAWYMVTSTFVSRGRRGTWRHGSSVCVAGVARMALGWLWWRARFPRARVAAAAVCVAGVALGDIHLRFMSIHNLSTHNFSHLLFHTQLTPHQSFTISFLFPAFPMPSLLLVGRS